VKPTTTTATATVTSTTATVTSAAAATAVTWGQGFVDADLAALQGTKASDAAS